MRPRKSPMGNGVVKRRLIVCVTSAVASLAALFTYPCAAEPVRMRLAQAASADAMPPYEIVAAVRSMGLTPLGRPARQGPYYVLHAADPRGVEMRVVADAQFGDVLSVTPTRQAATYNAAPRYDGGPRIIRVPEGFNRVMPGDGYDDEPAPPPPVYNRTPRTRDTLPPADYEPMPRGYDRRSTAPPPPPPPRAVLAPPSYRPSGPSPVKPLPRPPGAVDKFLPAIDPPAAPESEPQASADEPPGHITADGPVIPPPTPETKIIPPPEVKTPEPDKLIEMPPVTPLD